jgi:hypothetical protein
MTLKVGSVPRPKVLLLNLFDTFQRLEVQTGVTRNLDLAFPIARNASMNTWRLVEEFADKKHR